MIRIRDRSGDGDVRFTRNCQDTLGECFLPDQFETVLDPGWTEIDPEEHTRHGTDPRREPLEMFMSKRFKLLATFSVECGDGVRVG